MIDSLILGFVSNLMFTSRIEQVAESLGYRLHWVESAEQIAPGEVAAPRRQLGEPLLGQEGILVEWITRLGPVLMIFDLGNAAIPWERWLPVLKTIPATRRIPIIAFGPHVEVETLKKARQLGADEVVARSRFVTALPELIQKFARRTDQTVLAESCQEPLHPKAIEGMKAFNAGDYFEAHELLEEAWMEDLSLGRELYRAILQVAVAYLQIRRGNYRGAVKMFLRVRQWIDPLPEICRGVQVAALRAQAYAAHDVLLALGPEQISEFDSYLMQPVQWDETDEEI